MGRPRTTECAKGHKRTEENTRIAKDGSQACRTCDAERHRERQSRLTRKAGMATDLVDVTEDALLLTEQALDLLLADYADNPKDHELGQRVGWLTNRLVSLKRARAPKPAPEPQAPYVRMDGRQFDDALPAHCPICEGRGHRNFDPPIQARGYVIRYGETRGKCDLCDEIFSLEAS